MRIPPVQTQNMCNGLAAEFVIASGPRRFWRRWHSAREVWYSEFRENYGNWHDGAFRHSSASVAGKGRRGHGAELAPRLVSRLAFVLRRLADGLGHLSDHVRPAWRLQYDRRFAGVPGVVDRSAVRASAVRPGRGMGLPRLQAGGQDGGQRQSLGGLMRTRRRQRRHRVTKTMRSD